MELRKVVRVLTATIVVGTLASSASLVLITSYLHRLAIQIDSNLQSVRAAEEIQLHLLWHARNTNQAALLENPELAAAAVDSQSLVYEWYAEARRYISSLHERDVVERLGDEIEAYFGEHAMLAAAGISALDRYAEAVSPFMSAYDLAEELLHVNLEQAAAANDRGRRWDAIATTIGFAVAAILLVSMLAVIAGARAVLYRPLIALRDGIRSFGARDYSVRVPVEGVSEIREIALSFNDMAKALQQQRDSQLTFVAAVAHDLRNPLAAMKAAVEVLAAQQRSSGPHRQMTSLVSRQIDILVRMISDLLDFARVEAGKFSITPSLCDARDLATQVVELYGGMSALHELQLEVPDTPLPLRCDALRIGQVLNNVVSNAIKYSPRGGRVTVSVRCRDDRIVIEVTDQGPGIPQEEHELIFEPFKRSPGSEAEIPGVGLGLSVARRIVEAHGGTIGLQSTLGRGATFSIALPAATAATADTLAN
jgi:two-component system sensor histidine kinase MtrB